MTFYLASQCKRKIPGTGHQVANIIKRNQNGSIDDDLNQFWLLQTNRNYFFRKKDELKRTWTLNMINAKMACINKKN